MDAIKFANGFRKCDVVVGFDMTPTVQAPDAKMIGGANQRGANQTPLSSGHWTPLPLMKVSTFKMFASMD